MQHIVGAINKKLNIKELNNSNLEEELNKNGINKSTLGCK